MVEVFEGSRTWVNAVEVVEIRREAESLNCAVDVLPDVLRRVGDFALWAKHIESTF